MSDKESFFSIAKEYLLRKRKLLKLVRSHYANEQLSKKRNYEMVKRFFEMSKKEQFTLDNQTWDDLNMNQVYEKLDRTYSSFGEAVLYQMLRNPIMEVEKLVDRSKYIALFQDDKNLRERIQCILFNGTKSQQNSFLAMVEKDLVCDKVKFYAYTFVGKVLPVIAILFSIFVNPQYFAMILVVNFLNLYINMKEVACIKSNGMAELRNMILCAKKIVRIQNVELKEYTEKIAAILKKITVITKSTRFIGFEQRWVSKSFKTTLCQT